MFLNNSIGILENNNLISFWGTQRDITEKRHTEIALKEAYTIINRSPSVAFLWKKGNNWPVEYVSENVFKLCGYSEQEFKEQKISYSDLIHENDIERVTLEVELASNNITVHFFNHKPYRIKTKNNGIKWVQNNSYIRRNSSNEITHYEGIIHDITTEIESQNKLIAEKNKAQNYLNIARVMLVSIDTKGIVQLINPKGCEILGYKEEEIVGKNWFDNFLPKTNLDQIKEVTNLIFKGKLDKLKYYENNILTKQGEERLIAWNNEVIYDEKGTIISTLSSGEDITERKKLETDLINEKTLFKAIIDNIPVMLTLYDPNINMLFLNNEFETKLGITAEEAAEINVMEFFYPNEDIRKQASEHMLNAPNEWKEFPVKTKSGEVIDSEWINIKLKNGTQIGIGLDITERIKNQKVQKVLYQISNAVNTTKNIKQLLKLIRTVLSTVIDTTNFYIALVNKETNKIELSFFEDEKDHFIEIPTTKTITNYIVETGKPLLVTGKQLQLLGAKNNFEVSGALPKSWLGVPLNIGGEIGGTLVVQNYKNSKAYSEEDKNLLVFVSDQIGLSIQNKKYEENLKFALEKATESDNLKTAFLHNISHEIRTPMNGILGFSSLLKNPDLSGEKQQTYVNIITKSGERMLSTLNDLMDISKLETGQVSLNLTEVNIIEELEILYSFFKNEAQNKGLLFHLKLPKGNNKITVLTDREKLYAILSNLIKNAIKFTAIGGIEFGYTIKGDFIEFYFMDSGIGIPKNRQIAIFERFVQADIHDIHVYEGSGLGLSISKSYIELLGGTIWVDSIEKEGSKFYFTIPLNKETRNTSSKILGEMETEMEAEIPNSKKINVLIVEDEESASIYLSIILEDYCENIYRAKDGIEALDIFKANPTIDLILMDIKMPKMGGYETTLKIRELNKEVIIIAQTAFTFPGDKEKALLYGSTDFITKPIQINSLITLIKKYFDI